MNGGKITTGAISCLIGASVDSRSPVQQILVLRRIDPDRHVARFYSLMIERDLFGAITLVRSLGRIGTACPAGTGCRERVEASILDILNRSSRRLERPGTDSPGLRGSCGCHLGRMHTNDFCDHGWLVAMWASEEAAKAHVTRLVRAFGRIHVDPSLPALLPADA